MKSEITQHWYENKSDRRLPNGLQLFFSVKEIQLLELAVLLVGDQRVVHFCIIIMEQS